MLRSSAFLEINKETDEYNFIKSENYVDPLSHPIG